MKLSVTASPGVFEPVNPTGAALLVFGRTYSLLFAGRVVLEDEWAMTRPSEAVTVYYVRGLD